WSYCVGALKHGEGAEAVQAASRFANLVRTKLGKNANGEDEMLFNLVLYLALDDSSWTDYHYRIYNGADTDPELLAEFEKDAFLHNYVQAAYWEKQCQDPQKALPFARAALSMQEQSGRLWYLNAIIYYDSGVFDKALECYKRADALEPDDPSILFGLANTYDALEDYKTAYQYCERALAHYPSGVDHSYDNYGVSYHARDLLNRLRPYVEVDES
ncbi:MAG: tetratricopeptide repeat protein, partial [Oscillospiraceae bacterium]|nr:tetratricopeptide repeat protein [Oscillospiraceae bacterium]